MGRCKNCNNKFNPRFKTTEKYCWEVDCKVAESMAFIEKQREAKRKKQNKEKAEKKKELMTLSDWLKIAQATFNHYIRLRDVNQNCISCNGKLKNGNIDCGHYHSAGGHYNVRFNEDNCHSQCSRPCNKDKAGDLINYRKGLINRIGIERLEYLDSIANITCKFTIDEVKEINETYKNKIKSLQNK